jgi:hypothetical protein
MLQKIGFFHFANPDKSQPLASLKARLDERDKDDLKNSLVVLPEAFNLRGEYTPRADYDVEPSISVKHSLTQLAKQFDMVFVVGLIDNDEPDRPKPPYSSSYLITSTCYCCLSRKIGRDDLADCPHDQRLYQPFPHPSDTPSQHDQKAHIAGLLCMDAVRQPCPHIPSISNCARHDELKADMAKLGSALPILGVPARMRSLTTKGIDGEWPDVHFVLANACPPSDSNTHPSVIRIKGRDPVMYPNDPSTILKDPDAIILEPFDMIK